MSWNDDDFGHDAEHRAQYADIDSDSENLGKARILGETNKAVRARLDRSGMTLWIPKSVIHDDSPAWKVNDYDDLIVKTWWAKKERLV